MALVQAIAHAYLTHLHGGTAPAALTSPVRLALATSAPSATAAGTEVSGGGYARQATSWAAASGGSQATNAAISFTNMPSATVTHVELYDSAGTPVRVEFGALSASKTVQAGDTLSFASGALTSALA